MTVRRALFALACIGLGFLGTVAVRSRPADPAARLAGNYRLADLIRAEQRQSVELRDQVARRRDELAAEQQAALSRQEGA
ncbi:MAG: hypothetical protein ACRD0M_12125, partial [Acidimicrobiales bacterium]